MLAWCRLLRLSLAPTLCADLAAGAALVAASPWRGLRLLPVSFALFVAGMALNARVDLEEDRRTRPERPLPSGAIAPGAATAVAVAGLLAAPLLAFGIRGSTAALWSAGMAALVALYHTPLRRVALLGPAILASIRAADLTLGALASAEPVPGSALALPAVLYALYVFGASNIAREEDRAVPSLGAVKLGLMISLASLLTWVGFVWSHARTVTQMRATGGVLLLAWFLVRPVWSKGLLPGVLESSPGRIGALAGSLLGSMALFTASLACGAGSFLGAGIATSALLLVRVLVRWIPPT